MFASAGGVIVDDFDSDGRLDLLTSSIEQLRAAAVLPARPRRARSSNAASAAGLGDQRGGLNIVQTDYDNDGCLDVLVLRGGWELPQRKSLLRNNCQGTFTDVTAASGLAGPATSTQAAAWADVDNDGLLDLFVGSEDSAGAVVQEQAAMARSRTSPRAPVWTGRRSPRAWPLATTTTTAGPTCTSRIAAAHELPVSQQRQRHVHGAWRRRPACRARAAASPHGSSTTTTTAGRTSSPRSYFTSVEETARTYLGCPTTPRR